MTRKRNIIAAALISISVMLLSFSGNWSGSVKGRINPGDAALRAFVFSAKDTVSANVLNGGFMILNVKPGTYTLLVEGKPPYRNLIKESISVVDGEPTDVGMIEMLR
jgi:hypothetical protein